MKTIFLCLCPILISVSAYCQGNLFYVHGVVVEDKTGTPLSNASVFCQNTTTGTISNAEGQFGLRLSNGGYDLVVSYTGYETQVLRVSNSTKDKDSLTIRMKEQSKSPVSYTHLRAHETDSYLVC